MRPRRVNTQPPTPERVRAMRYRRTWVAAVANTLAAVLLFGFSPTRESHPVATAKETARSIAELDRAELDRAELDRARLLLSRATYGPRPQDLEELLAIGAEAWVERQLRPESIAESSVDKRLDSIEDLSLTTTELMVKYPRPTPEERRRAQQRREQEQNEPLRLSDSVDPEMDDGLSGNERRRTRGGQQKARQRRGRVVATLSQAKLLRAAYSERQLQEVMADFWFNHFNVDARKNPNTMLSLVSYERDAIRPHALAKFEDLLLATAQHPAMLLYLDNWTNTKEGFDAREAIRDSVMGRGSRAQARRGRQSTRPTRRRPGNAKRSRRREGGKAVESNRPRRQAGLNENYARELLELHTLGVDGGYTQDDVVEVARVFTGWSVVTPELSERLSRVRERLSRRGRGSRNVASRLSSLPDPGNFYFNALAHDEKPKTVLGARIGHGGMDDGLAVIRLLSQHPSTARHVSTKLAQRFVSDTPSEALVGELSLVFLESGGDIRKTLHYLLLSDAFVTEGLRAEKVKTPLELAVSAVRATDARIQGLGLIRTLGLMGMPLYMCQPPTGYDEQAESWLSAGSLLTRVRFAGELIQGRVPGVRIAAVPNDLPSWSQAVLLGPMGLSTEDTRLLEDALGDSDEMSVDGERKELAVILASPAFQKQ